MLYDIYSPCQNAPLLYIVSGKAECDVTEETSAGHAVCAPWRQAGIRYKDNGVIH